MEPAYGKWSIENFHLPSFLPELVPHVPVLSTSDALSEVNITRIIKSTMRVIMHCSPCDDTLIDIIMYLTSFLQSIREVIFQKRMTAVGSEFPTFLIGPPSFSKFAWAFQLSAENCPLSQICSSCILFLHVHTCYKHKISCGQRNKHKNHNEYFYCSSFYTQLLYVHTCYMNNNIPWRNQSTFLCRNCLFEAEMICSCNLLQHAHNYDI